MANLMNILKRNFDLLKLSFQYIFIGADRRLYPDTLLDELEYQCRRILPMAALACFLIPLGYLSVDQLNFPDKPILPLLRVGLSVASIIAFIVAWFRLTKYWGFIGVFILASYLLLQATFATLISNVEPAYMAGYILCLVIPALILPVPLMWLNILFATIYSIFFIGLWVIDFHHNSVMQLYSFQDFQSTIFITLGFGFLQAKTRESIYANSKKLEAERLEAEKLLRNILPESVADEFNSEGGNEPALLENVTIGFTHFIGFTHSLEVQSSIEEVINELNQCFAYFDSAIQNYGLEKLKTMGDKYMFAGGLPNQIQTHAIDCCLVALSMLDYVKKVNDAKNKEDKQFWKISIGIASGSVVAGIVGQKKFVYDVWGKTVSDASHIENDGLENKINVTRSTYNLIHEIFDCEPTDVIKSKPDNEPQSFIIERLRPKYSADAEGLIPNQELLEFRNSLLNR